MEAVRKTMAMKSTLCYAGRMKRLILAGIVLALGSLAWGQSGGTGGSGITGGLTVIGTITAGHCASFVSSASVQDSGAACGGAGTIGGSIAVNQIAVGSGANTIQGFAAFTATTPSASITNGALTLGVAGTTQGQLLLSGATSGTASFTPPAVAGTITNPVLFSNSIQLPSGTVYNWNGDTGLSRDSAATIDIGNGSQGDKSGRLNSGTIGLYGGGVQKGTIFNGIGLIFSGTSGGAVFSAANWGSGVLALRLGSSNALGWDSTANPENNTPDTSLTRSSAGALSVDGTGTLPNGLGSFTNCRTTVNVTPVTVNANVTTDQNLMAFTLPANCLNSVGRTLRIWISGIYSTPAASTSAMTLKVKLCSVSGCGSGNVATLINIVSAALGTLQITNNAFNCTARSTTQTAGAASRSEAHGNFTIDLGATPAAADSIFADVNTATIAGSPADIDFTAQNFLQVTMAFSAASASNSVTQRQLIMDSVN